MPELLPITCNGRSAALLVRTQRVQQGEAEMSASKFEQVCGKGDAKKWKSSIWVEGPDGSQVMVSLLCLFCRSEMLLHLLLVYTLCCCVGEAAVGEAAGSMLAVLLSMTLACTASARLAATVRHKELSCLAIFYNGITVTHAGQSTVVQCCITAAFQNIAETSTRGLLGACHAACELHISCFCYSTLCPCR